MSELIVLMPEIFILGMICIILLWDVMTRSRYPAVVYLLTQLTLIGAAAITLSLFSQPVTFAAHDSFVLDPLASVIKLGIYSVTFLAFWLSRDYIKNRRIPFAEYYLLALLALLGAMFLVSAHNLIVLFLGLELSALPVYAMVALWQDSPYGAEAAMKYFVLGTLASGMLLYGLSLIYGATTSLSIDSIAQLATANSLTLFALVFILAGIAFKFGAAPFHLWVPDVYTGAPTAVTLFISAAPKLAILGMTYRLLVDALPVLQPQWQQLLIVIAIASMLLGNFAAIVQTNLKRMLAYSSIAHMGYLSLGLLAGTAAGNAAALFYMLAYTLMAVGAFGLLTLLSREKEIEEISDLKGLNARHPWLAFMMLLIMFSMAGIPPTVGFFAKLAVLEAVISMHLVWLAVLALVLAVIGAYYYINVVKVMYFEEPEKLTVLPIGGSLRLAITISGLAVLLFGIFPGGIFSICHATIG